MTLENSKISVLNGYIEEVSLKSVESMETTRKFLFLLTLIREINKHKKYLKTLSNILIQMELRSNLC